MRRLPITTYYDAQRAGFTHVVFVVREALRETFVEQVAQKCSGDATWEVLSQDVPVPGDPIPGGLWGTTHAVLSARSSITGPFAVINADDYYGPATFHALARFFAVNSDNQRCVLVGFPIDQTLF